MGTLMLMEFLKITMIITPHRYSYGHIKQQQQQQQQQQHGFHRKKVG
jgi:hypothetical protein